jgi:toxin FitB
MRQGCVIALSDTLALGAARLSFEMKLPLADSIILYSARQVGATLWTQDAHFESVEDVRFVRKGQQG